MSAVESTPTPLDLLAEAEAELLAEFSTATGEPSSAARPQVTIPDPSHVIGDRPCPVCEGAGKVPFEIPASPRYMACPDCFGTGNVLTGSFDPECAMILCERCNARGYVDRETGEVSRSITNPQGEPPFPGMLWNQGAGEWRYP